MKNLIIVFVFSISSWCVAQQESAGSYYVKAVNGQFACAAVDGIRLCDRDQKTVFSVEKTANGFALKTSGLRVAATENKIVLAEDFQVAGSFLFVPQEDGKTNIKSAEHNTFVRANLVTGLLDQANDPQDWEKFELVKIVAVSDVCPEPKQIDGVGELRSKYVCEIETYLPLVSKSLTQTDTPVEEKAKILNSLRREIGLKYKLLTPKWLRNFIYNRNQKLYNDPLGPTYENLVAKGKSSAEIIASSVRTGGKDFLLDNRVFVGAINFLDYVKVGPLVEYAWCSMPGGACLVD